MNTNPGSRRSIIFVTIFLGAVMMMTMCFMFAFKSRSGERMTREDAPFSDLPADASEISFFIPGLLGRDLYLEFNTSEDGFYNWVESQQGTELEKRADGAFQINRFNFSTQKGQTIQIQNGVLFAWTDDPKGVFIGYDRDGGRAYFHSKAK